MSAILAIIFPKRLTANGVPAHRRVPYVAVPGADGAEVYADEACAIAAWTVKSRIFDKDAFAFVIGIDGPGTITRLPSLIEKEREGT